jgi:hypothetical protein
MLSVKEIFFLTLIFLQGMNTYAQSVKITQLLNELTIVTKAHEFTLQQQNITLLELVKIKNLPSLPAELPLNLPKQSQSIVEYSFNHPAEIILLGTVVTLGCYFVCTTIIPGVLKGLQSILFYQTITDFSPSFVAGLPTYDNSLPNINTDVVNDTSEVASSIVFGLDDIPGDCG